MAKRVFADKSKISALALVTSLMLLLLLSVRFASAGTGTVVDGSPHLLNLNLFYNYDETDMDIFETALIAASELLHCATDGQMQIGSVRVSKNPAFQDKADIWVLEGESGAYATVGGLGDSGYHITVFRDQHRFTNLDGPDSNERGHFGIIHEMGHYAFNLYDEYIGPGGDAYCVSATSTVACIMDGGTTISPNNQRTEFCTEHDGGLSTEHIETPNTNQQNNHGESCWETISSYCSTEYGITMNQPTAEAGHTNPACPTGHVDPAWIVLGDKLRYVICIDKSYSMVGAKMDLTKIAAKLFVDLVHEDEQEYLGITSFSDIADVDFPLEEVTTVSPTTKDRAKDAIDAISVVDMTAMGDGLRASFREITGDGTFPQDDACVEAIILLSDGVHNFGTEAPADVIPDLRDRGVMVFTLGLGDPNHPTYPLDENTLRHIADQTGGEYRHAVDETSLSTIYAEYSAAVRGDEQTFEDTGAVDPETSEELKVLVDAFSDETTFLIHWPIHWPEGKDIFDLELVMPDGTTIDPYFSGIDPNINYVETDFYEFYRIKRPKEGSWTLRITATNASYLKQLEIPYTENGLSYTSQVFASAKGVSSNVATSLSLYNYTQIPTISVLVTAGYPVANASITGSVIRPDGTQVPIALFDDGSFYFHGDYKANDGVYSNRFLNFNVDGSYGVTLLTNCTEAVQAIPDEIPLPVDWTPEPVKPLIRVARTTFMIEGIPPELPSPKVNDIQPNQGKPKQTLDVKIIGENFVENSMIRFSDPGIEVLCADCIDQNTITATIKIHSDAPLGARNVEVINPGGQTDSLSGGFTVITDNWLTLLLVVAIIVIILIVVVFILFKRRGRK